MNEWPHRSNYQLNKQQVHRGIKEIGMDKINFVVLAPLEDKTSHKTMCKIACMLHSEILFITLLYSGKNYSEYHDQ